MTRVEIEFPEQTLFTCNAVVRVTDLSGAMHLGFDSLVGIVNDASAHFFTEVGFPRGGDLRVNTIYADLAVCYRSEAFHGDELTVEVGVGGISEKRLDVVFRVTRKEAGREVALARIGVLFFDYDKKRVVEIPDRVRKWVGSKLPRGARKV